MQTRPRVTRYDARQEREVVLDDALVDRPAGDVDDAQTGLAEQQEHEEEALLHGLYPGAARLGAIRRDGRHDDDRLARLVQAHGVPACAASRLLQPLEARPSLVLAELAQPRLVAGDEAHAGSRAASSPRTL